MVPVDFESQRGGRYHIGPSSDLEWRVYELRKFGESGEECSLN
jgi:hypothetical protein